MNEYWNDIFSGTKSLVIGMNITVREFFKPVVTEQYPAFCPGHEARVSAAISS